MALVAPECFLGLSPEERRQQMYEAIYTWAGDETLTDPACFLGLSPEEGFIATVSAMQAPATDAVCLVPFQDQLRVLYAVAYEKAEDDTLAAPECLPLELDEQEQALYAAFYSLSSQGDGLTHPDNFLCLSPDERQLALFKVLSDLATEEPEFNPADYGTVALWLKADALTGYEDEDVIDTWPDSSGSGNDATQSTFVKMPVYHADAGDGRPALLFDGIDDGLETGIPLGSEWTVFVVAKSNTDNAAIVGSRQVSSGDQDISIFRNAYQRWSNEPLNVTYDSAIDWSLFEVSESAAGGGSAWVNGQSKGTNNNLRAWSNLLEWGIGYNPPDPFTFLAGYIREVLIFSGVVASENRAPIRQYLSRKHNLTLS